MDNCACSILLRNDILYEAKVNLTSAYLNGDIVLDVNRYNAAGFDFETLPDIRIVGYRTSDQHGNIVFEMYYQMEGYGNLEYCIGLPLERETRTLEQLLCDNISYICSEIDWEKMASIL